MDPNMSQLVEVPINQAGAYVIQDASGVISSNQIQLGNIQGGKSLLKPELAQHLNQHTGYKANVGRGGFTMGGTDPRWASINATRASRNITRKPLGTGTSHIQSGNLGATQSAVLAPTASGLLSLGTRYTPSSASAFGNSVGSLQSAGGGNIITPATASTNAVSASVNSLGGMSVDRDTGYRLAAAIAGTSGRGRPRGRRPLRGQFPVVPIDMVRQLGIEQQVILQPAAPVAMRNKAVLCRPLSMCRKTQVNIVQSENTNQQAVAVQTDKAASDNAQQKDTQTTTTQSMEEGTQVALSSVVKSDPLERSYSIAETSTRDDIEFVDAHSQTDTVEEEKKMPLFLPIPVPVPIYVPFPVCLYARPVPFAIPLPLPCPVPFPLATENKQIENNNNNNNNEKNDASTYTDPINVTSNEQNSALSTTAAITTTAITTTTSVAVTTKKTTHLIDSSATNVAVTEKVDKQSTQNQSSVEHGRSNLKRPNSSQSSTKSSVSAPTNTTTVQPHSVHTRSTPSTAPPAQPGWESSEQQAPSKRPRQTYTPVLTSDANYHLKFSYGINAWRHWVQQKSSTDKTRSAASIQQHSQLYTDLLNMPDADLNTALSQFVREVRKPNNECYVADSIFYLCLGIQEYLNENGRTVNIFGGPAFRSFSSALDEILANFQPRISPEGLLICRIEEEHLWEARQLGSESPEILLFTMLYFNTKHFGLRLGTAHRQLAFAHFQVTDSSILCHLPGRMFGEMDEAVTTLRLDMNHQMPQRCPVRLFKTYVTHCPRELRQSDSVFYLNPLYPTQQQQTDSKWYSSNAMDSSELQVILNRIKMVKEIQEAFMNGQPDGGF